MEYRLKLFLFILLLTPLTIVNAEESISIDCNKEKKLYVCKIEGNFDYEISAIDFHYSLPDYAKLESYELDKSWLGTADENWLSVYSSENFKTNFSIMEMKISSKKKINNDDIELTDILVYDNEFQPHEVNLDVKQTKKCQPIVIIVIICGIIILTIILLGGKKIKKMLKRGETT